MLKPPEHLLGFDARLPPAALPAGWTPERRAMYLLRPDVEAPLSTDVHVWASVAAVADGPSGAVRPMPAVWADLAALRRALAGAGPLVPPGSWTVAFTRVGKAAEDTWWNAVPAEVDPAWTLLGYDVSDAALLSGLSNCGYGARAPGLRPVWAEQLNGFHLFGDPVRADAFRAATDLRVPEHAPFHVHGLYRV